MTKTPTGVQLIEAEHARQVAERGASPDLDSHARGLVVGAARRLDDMLGRSSFVLARDAGPELAEVGARIARALDALNYVQPAPPVRGQDITDGTDLVEGMGIADRDGHAWWYADGRWVLARTYSVARDRRRGGAGISMAGVLAHAPLLITYVPEATS